MTRTNDYFRDLHVAALVPDSYLLEEHFVTTADGYILRLFNLRAKAWVLERERHSSSEHSSPVVYLQHALLDSSAGWLIMGPGKSLGFILADAGQRDATMTMQASKASSMMHALMQGLELRVYAKSRADKGTQKDTCTTRRSGTLPPHHHGSNNYQQQT